MEDVAVRPGGEVTGGDVAPGGAGADSVGPAQPSLLHRLLDGPGRRRDGLPVAGAPDAALAAARAFNALAPGAGRRRSRAGRHPLDLGGTVEPLGAPASPHPLSVVEADTAPDPVRDLRLPLAHLPQPWVAGPPALVPVVPPQPPPPRRAADPAVLAPVVPSPPRGGPPAAASAGVPSAPEVAAPTAPRPGRPGHGHGAVEAEPPGPRPSTRRRRLRPDGATLLAGGRRAWRLFVHPDSLLPWAAVVAVVMLVTGLGYAALNRQPSTAPVPLLDATQGTIDQADQKAAAGDVDGAVALLDGRAAVAITGLERARYRGAAATILATAAGKAELAGDPRTAVRDARRAAAYDDTPPGVAAAANLPELLLDAARTLLRQGDTSADGAGYLAQVIALVPGTPKAATARQLLTAPVPVRGRLTVGGSPASGVEVLLIAPAAAGAPAPASPAPAGARAQVGADGGFDLGAVVPGTYTAAYAGADGVVHTLGGAVTIAAAAVTVLTLSG